MRILTWTNTFWPGRGGLERLLTQLVPELGARGHQQLVVTQTLPEAAKQHAPLAIDVSLDWSSYAGQPVHRIPVTKCLDEKDVRGIAKATADVRALRRDFGADVVNMVMCGSDGLALLATDDGTPILAANHLSIPFWFASRGNVLSKTVERADEVVVVSEAVRRETISLIPESAGKLRKILNGVPVTPDPPPLPGADPVILMHGRLVAEKGFAMMLVAFSLLLEQRPDVRLVVAGDGYARQGLEHLAKHLGVTSRVEFTGWVDECEIQRLIDRSSVVVVPSLWNEPFGLTAAEASERARPVVASRVGGLGEVVLDGETGMLVQAGDPLQYAAAIDALLADPDRAAEMGAAGRRRIHDEFAIERMIDEYEAALQGLVR